MAFQGFVLFAVGAFGLASLLYYMYANNAPEQPHESDPYTAWSPDFNYIEETYSNPRRFTSNSRRSNSNRRKRQSSQSESNATLESHCTICLRKIKDEGKLLPCRHRFHVHCIEEWESQGPVGTRYTCPNCRKSYVRSQ